MNSILLIIKSFAATQCYNTLLLGQVCDDCHGSAIMKLIVFAIQVLTVGLVVTGTIGLIIVGLQVLTARDDAGQLARAKSRLLAIVIGLGCYAVLFAVLNFVIPGGVTTSVTESDCSGTSEIATADNTKYPELKFNNVDPITGENPNNPSNPSDPSNPGGGPSPSNPSVQNIEGYTPATKNPAGTTTFNGVGDTWTMVNTKFSVPDYMNSLKKRKVAQDNKDCYDNGSCTESTRDNDKCLSFAYAFGYDLIHGTTTCDHCASQYKRGGFYGIKTQSKDEALSMIYDQLVNGWPVVVQVKYYPNGTGRHFVTAVAIKSSVTSREQFTEDDILFLNTDGKLWRSDGVGKVGQPGGGVGSTKSSLKLFKKDYGYYVLPAKNPNPDAKASNYCGC